MILAGILNVALNLLFVIRFHWDIAGVALATVLSEFVSAVLVWRALRCNKESSQLIPSKLKINGGMLRSMLAIGIPAGLQSASFSVSNMIIQSSVNSLGAACMAACAACSCLEGLIYISGFGFHQAVVSVVGQNLGAQNYRRIVWSLVYCVTLGTLVVQLFSTLIYLNGEACVSIFNHDPEVIRWGVERMAACYLTYGFCATMDISSGGLRGLGKSTEAAVIAIAMICILRVIWVLGVFPSYRTIFCLMLSYPISWILSAGLNLIILWREMRKLKRRFAPLQTPVA